MLIYVSLNLIKQHGKENIKKEILRTVSKNIRPVPLSCLRLINYYVVLKNEEIINEYTE